MSDDKETAAASSQVEPTSVRLFGEDATYGMAWLYTNRLNLLEFLSSRLLKPVAGYVKYYRDASVLTPGALPLFRSAPSPALMKGDFHDEVGVRPPSGVGAVALQVDVRGLTNQYLVLEKEAQGVVFVAAVLPLRFVEAIHFPNVSQLSEHNSRSFAGIPRRGPPLAVTPHLFESSQEALSPEQLHQLYRRHEFQGFVAAEPERFLQLDSIGGGFAMAFGESGSGPLLASLAGTSTFESGVEVLVNHLLGSHATDVADRLFLSAIINTLSRLDREAESVSAFLEAVRQEVGQRGHGPVIGIVDEYLRGIEMVIDGERAVRPFAPGGLAAGKALLLFLLDPAISAVDRMEQHRTNPDALSIAIAKTLIGLRTGRSRLPETYRPEGVEEVIIDYECAVLNRGSHAVMVGPVQHAVSESGPGPADWSKLIRLFGEDVPKNAKTRAEAHRIVNQMGWHDCASTTVYGVVANGGHKAGSVAFSGIPRVVTRINYGLLRKRLSELSSVSADESPLLRTEGS